MTDHEKTLSEGMADSNQSGDATAHGDLVKPEGWMYRDFRLGPLRVPWYASPPTQLTMVAFVCFLCPGMFNALSGLGGGGQVKTGTYPKKHSPILQIGFQTQRN